MAMALVGGGQRVATGGGTKGSSLRLVTYNTAFVSITFGPPVGTIDFNDGMAGMDYEQRAVAIATGIIRDDTDIVALNEVFSDEAKDVLVQLLAPVYPHYIKKIRGEAPNPAAQVVSPLLPPGAAPAETSDSGLMLFSKYPFVPFSSSASPLSEPGLEIEGWNGTSSWGSVPSQVSARVFKTAAGGDGLASKAVTMARILNPNDGQIVNVALTHLQASYESPPAPEETAARRAQFQDIKRLIVNSLTQGERQSQQVYVLGDLNVNGGNKGSPADEPEWQSLFKFLSNAVAGFFSCGNAACAAGAGKPFMTDLWGFETSTHDPGVSNNVENQRLDYVLHNKPLITDVVVKPPVTTPMCAQHVAIAYELGQPTPSGVLQLSDHLGLRADFNKQAKHCSPDGNAGVFGPRVITFSASSQERQIRPQHGARITYPGSMQWYRIDKAGSYSVQAAATSGDRVGVAVYAAADLSRPLSPFYGEVNPRYGPKYVMTDPPYYVRVFAKDPATGAPDRSWTGTYTITFHEYRGTSPDDSISLAGGYKQAYQWPGPGTQEYPRVWFDFHTNNHVVLNLWEEGDYLTFYHTTGAPLLAPLIQGLGQREPGSGAYTSSLTWADGPNIDEAD